MDTNPVGSQRAGKEQRCCGLGLQDVHVTITRAAGMYQQNQLQSYIRAKWLFQRLIRKKDLSLWETSSHNQQILLSHRIAKQGMLCPLSRVMNFPSKGGDRAEKLHRNNRMEIFHIFIPRRASSRSLHLPSNFLYRELNMFCRWLLSSTTAFLKSCLLCWLYFSSISWEQHV